MTHPAQYPLSSLGGLRTPVPRARRATIMGPPSANLHKGRTRPRGKVVTPLILSQMAH